MFIALIAPEALLFLAINERITAGVMLKKVLKFHPHLVKPGMFTRMYNWVRGRSRAELIEVSVNANLTWRSDSM